jgi:hypothetical protein
MRGAWKLTAGIVAVAVLGGVLGACSSDGRGHAKPASKQQRAAAQQKRIAAQRAKQAARRQQAARMQAWARKRARAEAERARVRRARLVRIRRARAAGNPARDHAAIRRSVRSLNAAFDAGVMRGIVRSVALNHWVVAGVYDPGACIDLANEAGEGVVAERLLIRPGTFRATPGWVDPAVGQVPSGRLYAMTVDEIQTLVPTGEQRVAVHELHASVGRNGKAHLFFRCA